MEATQTGNGVGSARTASAAVAGSLPEERRPSVVVVVLNHNGLADTLECYRSLRAQDYPALTILIVDNGSLEPGTERLRDACPDAEVIFLDRNHGFAGGCNVGMRRALERGADLIWLLNNDTVARPDAASVLVRAAADNPHYGFFGNLIAMYDEPDTLWFGGGDLNLLTGGFHHRGYGLRADSLSGDRVEAATVVTGCSILVRADTVRRIGVFDPHYFAYWEEIDWQLRGRRAGEHAALVREVLVLHKVGRTTMRIDEDMTPFLLARNCLLVARTHAGAARPLWFARAVLSMVIRPFLSGETRRARAAPSGLRKLDVPPERLFASARPAEAVTTGVPSA